MELERELGPLVDLSRGEGVFAEVQSLVPNKAALVTGLLEIAVTEAILVYIPGLFVDDASRALSPLPIDVPPEFVVAVASKFDTCRTNRCKVTDELPSPQPKFRDFLLFSGDAAKAEEVWGEYGSATLADQFFQKFDDEFLPTLNTNQSALSFFDLEQGSVYLHAALWRLALDVSLGPQNGGDIRGHFADSARYLAERGFQGPLQKVISEWGATGFGDTHTILFTDMQSSTALTQRLGDAGAQEIRRAHNEIVRSALAAHGGSEIKHTGDGIMADFATAPAALDSAIAIQQGVASHTEEHPDSPLAVYVGLNAGEPIAEEDDLFGTSVHLAARLVEHAQPGQIIASDTVRELAAGTDFLFSDLGERELRGFEDPVKLWELRWQGD